MDDVLRKINAVDTELLRFEDLVAQLGGSTITMCIERDSLQGGEEGAAAAAAGMSAAHGTLDTLDSRNASTRSFASSSGGADGDGDGNSSVGGSGGGSGNSKSEQLLGNIGSSGAGITKGGTNARDTKDGDGDGDGHGKGKGKGNGKGKGKGKGGKRQWARGKSYYGIKRDQGSSGSTLD